MSRLMGFRKLEDEMKVVKMNMVPTSEKHDATRVIVSIDLNWERVKEAAMNFELSKKIVIDK